MVSRRNFATITIMLMILLFMFQFTGVMKDKLSKYGINEYKESATTELTKQNMYLASGQNIQKTAGVLYIGNSEAVKNTVKWWCTYSKREFQTADSFDGIVSEDSRLPDIWVLDGTPACSGDGGRSLCDAGRQ